MDVTWYTTAPSPHLEGLLNALAEQPGISLRVVYFFRSFGERHWESPSGKAEHQFVSDHKSTSWHGRCENWGRTVFSPYAADSAVAIVSSSYFDLTTHLLVRALRLYKIPWVFFGEAPSRISPSVIRLFRRCLAARILGKANGLVGVTEETAAIYRRDFGFVGPSSWAPYHRDLGGFIPVHRDSAPESLRFLVIGDLIPRKAPEVAVSALRQVSGPAELHFVGDGPLRGSLLAMAEHVNLDNVHFHGRIAYREVCAKLSCADVLVFPSRWDGFGMATLEALAAGLPVIASNRVMSALQYVRPGVNGWVFPVDDVAALAERMQFVIDHREDLPKWSAAALATLSEYNPMRDASRLAELLRFVSSSQKGSGTARTPGSSPSAVVGS